MRQRTTAESPTSPTPSSSGWSEGGYAVSVFRMGDYVETHGVQLKLPCAQHIATVWDGDGEEHLYQCVRELARLIGRGPAE